MCPVSGPAALAISAAIAAASAAATIAAQRSAAKGRQNEANFQAAVATNDAIRGEQKAERIRLVGENNRADRLAASRSQAGKINTALAANGVVVNEGTALELKLDALDAGQVDARMIAHNAEVEALSAEADAGNSNSQAQLSTLRGENAIAAGKAASFNTLLSSANSVAGKWYGRPG